MPMAARGKRIMGLLAELGGDATVAAKICLLCARLAGVNGVAMTVITRDGQRHLVHATDDTARLLNDVQVTSGQGPGIDALATRAPVLVPELGTAEQRRWPQFVELISSSDVVAVFSVPLQVGVVRLGMLQLYRITPGPLSGEQLADTLVCSDVATQTLLAGSAGPVTLTTLEGVDLHPAVAQATGRVMVQLQLSATEALLRLRAHAYATGTPVTEVAHQVNRRELQLEAEQP